MSSLELQVYDIFKMKLGEAEASKIIEFIDVKTEKKVETKSELFEQIIQKDIAQLDAKLESKIGQLDVKIVDTKSEIIKWMFIFWIGQVAATFGFILLFLKK